MVDVMMPGCVLCGTAITPAEGFHDPFPLVKGEGKYCCITCEKTKVIPKRMDLLRRKYANSNKCKHCI